MSSIAALTISFFAFALGPLFSPLRPIPGPFLARFTRLWFLYRVWRGRFDQDLLQLHKKYGAVVRYGPSHYSFSSPEAIKAIYGTGNELDKSGWYASWNAPGFHTMFTEPSVKAHGQMRRKFQATFTMSALVTYESYAETCTSIVCTRLAEVAKGKGTTDLYRWLLSYAGDAVSMITYSRRMGFLDSGEDVGGLFTALHKHAVYSTLVGIFNEWHAPIYYFTAWLNRIGLTKGTPRMFVQSFTEKLIAEKRAERESNEKAALPESVEEDESGPRDFLTKFLDSHSRDPENFTERDIARGLIANIVAGSDTTAAGLTAIFYCLLKHPSKLAALRKELQQANLSSPATFKEGYALPYLQAVIQESLRMHAPIGLPLQRVVPAQGCDINGHYFPAGTIVGAHILAVHMSTDIFGPDAEEFRPERWLEKDTAEMQRYWIPFGLGSRTCIGKNISLLEITKLVPELVTKFDFELIGGLDKADVEMAWKNIWFILPVELPVKVNFRTE